MPKKKKEIKEEEDDEMEETEDDMETGDPTKQETEEEKTNDPLRKEGDVIYSDMREKVQEAVKDMISNELQSAMKPLIEKVEIASKMATDYKTEYDRLRKDMEAKDLKETDELRLALQEEPYGYAKDFVEEQDLTMLTAIKTAFEASKAYKDFETTQEEANKPNKEIFNASNIEDFVDYGMWTHLYGGKKEK